MFQIQWWKYSIFFSEDNEWSKKIKKCLSIFWIRVKLRFACILLSRDWSRRKVCVHLPSRDAEQVPLYVLVNSKKHFSLFSLLEKNAIRPIWTSCTPYIAVAFSYFWKHLLLVITSIFLCIRALTCEVSQICFVDLSVGCASMFGSPSWLCLVWSSWLG